MSTLTLAGAWLCASRRYDLAVEVRGATASLFVGGAVAISAVTAPCELRGPVGVAVFKSRVTFEKYPPSHQVMRHCFGTGRGWAVSGAFRTVKSPRRTEHWTVRHGPGGLSYLRQTTPYGAAFGSSTSSRLWRQHEPHERRMRAAESARTRHALRRRLKRRSSTIRRASALALHCRARPCSMHVATLA